MTTLYRPELLFSRGAFQANAGLLVDDQGYVSDVVLTDDVKTDTVIKLAGKALLPGFVNAHSHSFQRLIRGKAESRAASGRDFWSWRGCMYHAAASLTSEDVYDVARMAFLEMMMAGTTTVGEFHYLHTAPDGNPYDDPNLLAKQVIAAAQSVGIRIVLLRTAYFRSGYNLPPDPGQTRFIENTRSFLENTQALKTAYAANDKAVSIGVAPHSIRAVPLSDLRDITAWAREQRLPIHMHVAEQVGENKACVKEYGTTPVALLAKEKILGPDFTGVHSIHMDSDEAQSIAEAGATICSCPTTERNLGDGIIAADLAMKLGIRFALGSDSQAQIAPLEDARELEYHLRLAQQQRAILDRISGTAIATRLFDCATRNGARALGVSSGELIPGTAADFFTVDVDDLSICGHSPRDLLSTIVFSLERTALRDVAVQGRLILRDREHSQQNEIHTRYKALHDRVWA
jgi:formimidoylglutamate deiminase